jgi:hypothetical protein
MDFLFIKLMLHFQPLLTLADVAALVSGGLRGMTTR